VRWAAPFGLALAMASAHGGSVRAVALAIAAFAIIVGGRFRGGAIGAGVRTGALAGLVPLLCPILVMSLGHHCAGCGPSLPMPLCLAACAAGGVIAALWSANHGGRVGVAAAALATAALVGAVGCTIAGGFGLLGLGLGMLAAGVPVMVVRVARAR